MEEQLPARAELLAHVEIPHFSGEIGTTKRAHEVWKKRVYALQKLHSLTGQEVSMLLVTQLQGRVKEVIDALVGRSGGGGRNGPSCARAVPAFARALPANLGREHGFGDVCGSAEAGAAQRRGRQHPRQPDAVHLARRAQGRRHPHAARRVAATSARALKAHSCCET